VLGYVEKFRCKLNGDMAEFGSKKKKKKKKLPRKESRILFKEAEP
jgi:hypothetical protein